MNDDQIRDLLRDMRDEPVPADSAARVRQAVSAEIEARPRGWWKLALAAAVAVAVVALIVSQRPEAAPSTVVIAQPEATPEPAPEVVAPLPEPVTPELPAPTRRAPRRPVAAEPKFITTANLTTANPSMTIRLETDDPEVVILLVN